jgi:hypothetical protein
MNTCTLRTLGSLAGVASLVLCLAGCSTSEYKEELPGRWQAFSWQANGQPDAHATEGTIFVFEETGRYQYTYSGTTEQGEWYLSGPELFTTPDGGTKMMVRIDRLEGDTLVFDMNRGGTAERLTLVRKR